MLMSILDQNELVAHVSLTLFGGIRSGYKSTVRFSLVVYPTVRLQMRELFQQSAISRLAFRLADRTEQGGVERNEFFSLPLTLKCAFREVGDLTRDGVGRTVSAK